MSNASVDSDIFAVFEDFGEGQNEDQTSENIVLQWLLNPNIIGCAISAIFLLLCIPVNLANISTIAGHVGLRPSGYFHLVTLFSAFNIVFYMINFLVLAIEALFEWMPDIIRQIFKVHMWISDLVIGLIGLQILLLCVMTMEHRFDLSRHFYFKSKGQTVSRVVLTLTAFLLVTVSLVVTSLIRTTTIFWAGMSHF